MTYVLKHRDQALLRFNLNSDPIAGLSAEILECNSSAQSFFP
ncbi:MAG: XRE family transcriptional regulator, partial [Candidatus Electrothrix sp. AUS3]|nr:XRE family transcriptional regulator [Candidatus Electrothrix gigas]